MGKKIIIAPVTRVEGHGKVTVHLDDNNKVCDAKPPRCRISRF